MASKNVTLSTSSTEEQDRRDSNLRYQAVLVAQDLKPNNIQELLIAANKVFEYLKSGAQ